MRLIPAPRGTGIVSAPVPKKLLQMAGVDDCYTCARGQTATLGNFGMSLYKLEAKTSSCILAKATFAAIGETFKYLTPDMWPEAKLTKAPYQEHTDYLAKNYSKSQPASKPPEA